MKDKLREIITSRAASKEYPGKGMTRLVKNRSQFKGNTLNIQTCDEYITVTNTYWTSVVQQLYSIKDNKTYIEFRIDSMPLKWIRDKFSSFKTIKESIVVLGPNIKVYFVDYGSTHITSYMESNGCSFIDNGKAIDTLKNVRRTHQMIKDKFKILSETELINVIDEVEIDDHGYKYKQKQTSLKQLL